MLSVRQHILYSITDSGNPDNNSGHVKGGRPGFHPEMTPCMGWEEGWYMTRHTSVVGVRTAQRPAATD